MLGLTAAAGLTGAAILASRSRIPSPEKEKPIEKGFEFLDVSPDPRPYATGFLEHHKFSPKLTKITGIVPVAPEVPRSLKQKKNAPPPPARVPREANVDFSYQLAALWKEKVRLIENKNGSVPEEQRLAIKELFTSYHPESAEKADLVSYRERINAQVKEARNDVPLANIKHLRAFADFSQAQVDLLLSLEHRLTTQTLLAFSMTELMPTSGAQAPVGVDVYDWLLKNAGEAYIEEGMPSLADGEFSFGAYQFTPGVLSDEKGHPRGARLIEQLSTNQRLPADLGALRGKDQHRAAYLFSVHNLALLVRSLHDVNSSQLLALLPQMPADLVPEFVAVAHHNPDRANNVFKDYLYKYQAAVKEPDKYKRPDFADCCTPEGDLGPYVHKTRDNLQALRANVAGARAASQ